MGQYFSVQHIAGSEGRGNLQTEEKLVPRDLESFRGLTQQECYDRMEAIDRKAGRFAKELRLKGHVCVLELESYPRQISWCQNTERCQGDPWGRPREV